jgi:glycosyltransferase involved in cell wall biosynthesis
MNLSVIIPAFNEAGNIDPAYRAVVRALDNATVPGCEPWEIIFVDDGSTDQTGEQLKRLTSADPRVTVVQLLRNFGQTSALACGFEHASGEVIVTMDCDLQNDAEDIPKLVAALQGGAEIACARRVGRRDLRRFPTGLANWIVRQVTRVNLHDCAFPLKAFRRRYIDELRLCGDMHRYLGIYLSSWGNVPMVEVSVRPHRRHKDRSKYGASRMWKIVPDLILIKFLERYARRPIHFFGASALLLWTLAIATAILSVCAYFRWANLPAGTLAIISAAAFFAGWLALLAGLLAELVMRTYYETAHMLGSSPHRQLWPLYTVKHVWRSTGRSSAAGPGIP